MKKMTAFSLSALLALATLGGATPVLAKDAGDILVRVRGLAVVPDEGGTTDAIGGSASIDNSVVPEIDFTYFFTENIAAELILATTPHDVSVSNTSLGRNVDLGDVWLLPPTLTVQYHFMPKKAFSPYIGAGLNYTFFLNEDKGNDPAVTSVDYEDNFGYALQAGFDYKIDDRWSFNFDVKKLFLETSVTVNNGSINARDVDIDPWIVGIGFGYRF
ncbi:OmpW/AlkL family protein [Sneathiella aquimaris]|uniref:OmpW/AlkL family protein n=1 Tax=Sneathiella aquimaris TaxID=2599305 RepID=UPI001C668868|nr:OmpW family protein [Sneathiella aquimaris]